MDNPIQYGFRPFRVPDGVTPLKAIVATATAFNVYGGAQGVILRQGDPIYKLSTGGITLCPGSETTQVAPAGIVAHVGPYYDPTKGVMVQGIGLPSSVAWGTNLEHQSTVWYWPLDNIVFEVDVDDKLTATTKAAYQAFINENADHILCGASGELAAKPRLDISSHATTSTLMWRILGVSDTQANVSFAESYVKLLVRANVIGDAPFDTTGD